MCQWRYVTYTSSSWNCSIKEEKLLSHTLRCKQCHRCISTWSPAPNKVNLQEIWLTGWCKQFLHTNHCGCLLKNSMNDRLTSNVRNFCWMHIPHLNHGHSKRLQKSKAHGSLPLLLNQLISPNQINHQYLVPLVAAPFYAALLKDPDSSSFFAYA